VPVETGKARSNEVGGASEKMSVSAAGGSEQKTRRTEEVGLIMATETDCVLAGTSGAISIPHASVRGVLYKEHVDAQGFQIE